LRLQPWQVFIVASIFGWVHKETGLRRFREAYVCVPRKNGKSPLAAGIALYMLAADGEHGAEVYCGATTQQQAWEVFRPAKTMAEQFPQLTSSFGIDVGARALTVPATASRFLPVIGKPGDGASPSCGIADEYHEADTADLYDTLKTGMVGRDHPLLLVITTAGFNTASPCYSLQLEAQKVLEGALENERLFAVIYTIDAEDDWSSEEALRKANPNYGISVDADTLRHDQKIALSNPAKASVFRTKHLCEWMNAAVGWMNMRSWNKVADDQLKPEDFTGCDCFLGLDLSSKIDIAAKLLLFRKEHEGKDHYYAFPTLYLPEERALAPEYQHYQKWVAEGHLVATDGTAIDYSRIEADILADIQKFHPRELAFDPWNATDITQRLNAKTSIALAEIPQNVRNLSNPMKELEALVLSGRFHHTANPVFTWMASNVVARVDANGNVFPRKETTDNKIDGIVATLDALARALVSEPVTPSEPLGRMIFL
jgi:phage terminase large subunit-like protein